jgi:hypothetical protein
VSTQRMGVKRAAVQEGELERCELIGRGTIEVEKFEGKMKEDEYRIRIGEEASVSSCVPQERQRNSCVK